VAPLSQKAGGGIGVFLFFRYYFYNSQYGKSHQGTSAFNLTNQVSKKAYFSNRPPKFNEELPEGPKIKL